VTEPASCVFCDLGAGRLAPPGGALHREGGLLLAGSLDPRPVAGWCVVAPARHVAGWDALEPAEAAALGGLLRRAAAAVRAATAAERVYVASFAEAVPHLHVHLFPRGAGVPAEARGPRFLFDGAPRATAAEVAASARAVVERVARGEA
jgi:diadenosine tetraphosphate (Ap4A) HIT family hydrolase